MAADPTPMGLPITDAQAIEILVGLKIEDKAAGTPRLATGALWVRHLCPALARARIDATAFERVLVLVTAVYPTKGDPSDPPESVDLRFRTELPRLRDLGFRGFSVGRASRIGRSSRAMAAGDGIPPECRYLWNPPITGCCPVITRRRSEM